MSANLVTTKSSGYLPSPLSLNLIDSLNRNSFEANTTVVLSLDREDVYLQNLQNTLKPSSSSISKVPLSDEQLRHLIENLVQKVSFVIHINNSEKIKFFQSIQNSINRLSTSKLPRDLSEIDLLNKFLKSPFFHKKSDLFEDSVLDCSFYPFRLYQILLDLLKSPSNSSVLKIVGGFARETIEKSISPTCKLHAMDIDIKVDAKQFILDTQEAPHFTECFKIIDKISDEFLKYLIPENSLFLKEHTNLIVNLITKQILKNVKPISYQTDQLINIALGDISSRIHDITILANTSVESICNLDSARIVIDPLIRLLNQTIVVGEEKTFVIDTFIKKISQKDKVFVEGTTFFTHQDLINGWLSKSLKLSNDYCHFNESAFIKLMDFVSKGCFIEEIKLMEEVIKKLQPHLIVKSLNNHFQKHVSYKDGFVILLNVLITLSQYMIDEDILYIYNELCKSSTFRDELANSLSDSPVLLCFFKALREQIPFSIILSHFALIQNISLHSSDKSIIKSQVSSHLGLSIQVKTPFSLFIPLRLPEAIKNISSYKVELNERSLDILKDLVLNGLNPLYVEKYPKIIAAHSSIRIPPEVQNEQLNQLFDSKFFLNQLQGFYLTLLNYAKYQDNKHLALLLNCNFLSSRELPDFKFLEILNTFRNLLDDEILFTFLQELFAVSNSSKKTTIYLFILNSESSFCNRKFLVEHFIPTLYEESKNLNVNFAEIVFKRLDIDDNYTIFSTLNKIKANIKWCTIIANHQDLSKTEVSYEIFKSLYSFFKKNKHETTPFLLSLPPLKACKFFYYLQKQQFYSQFSTEEIIVLNYITNKNYDSFLSRVEKCFDLFLENFLLDKNPYDLSNMILKIAFHKCDLKIPALTILKNLLIHSYNKKLLKISPSVENLSISLAENLFQTHPITCTDLLHSSFFKNFKTPSAIAKRTALLEKTSKTILNLSETELSNLKDIFSKYSLADKTFYQFFLGNLKSLVIVLKHFFEIKTVTDLELFQFIEDFFATNPDITSFDDEDILFLGVTLNDLILRSTPSKNQILSKKSPPSTSKNALNQSRKARFIPQLFIRRLSEKNAKLAATLLSNSYKNQLIQVDKVDLLFKEVLSTLENISAEDLQFITDFWTNHQAIFKVNVSDKNDIFFIYLKLQKSAKNRLNILKQFNTSFKCKDYFEECFKVFTEEIEKDIPGTFNLLEVFLTSNKNKLINGYLFLLLNNLQLNEDSAAIVYKYITRQIFYDSLSQNNYLILALKILQLCICKNDLSHLLIKILDETFLKEISKADFKTFIQLLDQFNRTTKSKDNVLSLVASHANLIISRAEKIDTKAELMPVILKLLNSSKKSNTKNGLLSIPSLSILISHVKSLEDLKLIYTHLEKHPVDDTPLQQIQIISNFFNHDFKGLSFLYNSLIKKVMDAYSYLYNPCKSTLKSIQKSFEKTLESTEITIKEHVRTLTYLLPYPYLINDTIACHAVEIIAKEITNKNMQSIEPIVPIFASSILKDPQNKDLKKFIDYLTDSHDPFKISLALDLLLKNQLLNAYFFNKFVLFLKNYKTTLSLETEATLFHSLESLYDTAFKLDLHKKNWDKIAVDLNVFFIFLKNCKMTFSSNTFHQLPHALSSIIIHSNDLKLSTCVVDHFLKVLTEASNENALSLKNIVEKILLDLNSSSDKNTYESIKEQLYLAVVDLSLKIDDTYIRLSHELTNAIVCYGLSAKIKNSHEPLLLKKLIEKSITYLKNFYVGYVNTFNHADKQRFILKKQQDVLVENLSRLLPTFFSTCSYTSDVYNKFSFILMLSKSNVPSLIAASGFFLTEFCDRFDENTVLNEEDFKDVFVKLIKEKNFCNDVVDVSKILKHNNILKIVSKSNLAFLYKVWLKNEYLFFDNFDLNLYKNHVSDLIHDQNSNIEMAAMVVKNLLLNLLHKVNEKENIIDVCNHFCQDLIRLLNMTLNLDTVDIEKPSLEYFTKVLCEKVDSITIVNGNEFFRYLNFKIDLSSINLLSSILNALLVSTEEIIKTESITIFIFNFIEMFIQKLSSIPQNKTNKTIDLSTFRNLVTNFIFSPLWLNETLTTDHIERKSTLIKKASSHFENYLDDLTMLQIFVSKNFQLLNYKKNALIVIQKIIVKCFSYPQAPGMLVLGLDLFIANTNEKTYPQLKSILEIIPPIAFNEISIGKKIPVIGEEYILKLEQKTVYEHLINLAYSQNNLNSLLRSVFFKDAYTTFIQSIFNSKEKIFLISFERKTKFYIFLMQSLINFIKSELASSAEAQTILNHVKIKFNKSEFFRLADDAVLKNYFETIALFNSFFKDNYNLLVKCSNESDVEDSLLQYYSLSPFFFVLTSYTSVLSPLIICECKKMFLSWLDTLIEINTLKSLEKAKLDLNSFENFVDDKFELFRKITQREVLLLRSTSLVKGFVSS